MSYSIILASVFIKQNNQQCIWISNRLLSIIFFDCNGFACEWIEALNDLVAIFKFKITLADVSPFRWGRSNRRTQRPNAVSSCVETLRSGSPGSDVSIAATKSIGNYYPFQVRVRTFSFEKWEYLEHANFAQGDLFDERILLGLDEFFNGHDLSRFAVAALVDNAVRALSHATDLLVALHELRRRCPWSEHRPTIANISTDLTPKSTKTHRWPPKCHRLAATLSVCSVVTNVAIATLCLFFYQTFSIVYELPRHSTASSLIERSVPLDFRFASVEFSW